MFDDILGLTSQHMSSFSDTVKDGFGRSIIEDVFEPIIQEISGLCELNELFNEKINEIDKLTEELNSIGTMMYE